MGNRMDGVRQLSRELASRADQARPSVAAIRGGQRTLSGVVWQNDVLVTSAQSLPKRESYEAVTPAGERQRAALVGIDPATNIAVLRMATPLSAKPLAGRVPTLGELILAYGVDHLGDATARLGTVNAVGNAWHSGAGGQIDRRITLDIRLTHSEEGGPIFDTNGGFVGMSTFGPYQRVIAIPASTLERVVPVLLRDGQVARGWLGIVLQPVAVPEAFRDASRPSAALMAMAVAADGPASKAGVLAGDIVLSVDGDTTQRFRNLTSKLGSDSIGRRIELRLVRGGAVQIVPLTIEARPKE
jgi:S1-C subfamily serine protease